MENPFLIALYNYNLSKHHHYIGLKNQENETISLNNTTIDLISSIRQKSELERAISKQQVGGSSLANERKWVIAQNLIFICTYT
jgi:hypothetical protein